MCTPSTPSSFAKHFLSCLLTRYYDETIASIPFLSKLPGWLQKLIEKKLDDDAPGAIEQALEWVSCPLSFAISQGSNDSGPL